MSRRAWMGALGLVLLLGALVLLYDAVVETDEERLAVLVEEVEGDVTASRAIAARGRWVDLTQEPFELSALGESLRYGPGEEAALDARIEAGLSQVRGDRLSVLSHGIVVSGDEAVVTMRLLGRSTGMAQARFELARRGERWLLTRAVLQR